jgi:hypothetical protein
VSRLLQRSLAPGGSLPFTAATVNIPSQGGSSLQEHFPQNEVLHDFFARQYDIGILQRRLTSPRIWLSYSMTLRE